MVTKIHTALEESPEHAAALGRLLGHWGFLEVLLTSLMGHLLYLSPHKTYLIYNEIVSLRAKLKLLKRINHNFTINEVFKKEIHDILVTAENLNEDRNKFIHSFWVGNFQEMIRMEGSLPGNYKKMAKPYKKFTPQDIQDFVEDIAQLASALNDLLVRTSRVELTRP